MNLSLQFGFFNLFPSYGGKKMGEFTDIVKSIKENKENFNLVVDKMKPLINKYVKKLYKDEPEDSYAELVIALWESICNITYLENDGQVVNYLGIAIRNKFLELYRTSRKICENEIQIIDDDKFLSIQYEEQMYEEIICKVDMERFLSQFTGMKERIYYLILVENKSDSEISEELQISRQYVNRMRRCIQKELKSKSRSIPVIQK